MQKAMVFVGRLADGTDERVIAEYMRGIVGECIESAVARSTARDPGPGDSDSGLPTNERGLPGLTSATSEA